MIEKLANLPGHRTIGKEIDYSRHCGVRYGDAALAQDIKRLHRIWRNVQSDRHRSAIYKFLTAVFELIEWWRVERLVICRANRALALTGSRAIDRCDPFSAVFVAAIAPRKLERRKLSKYTRALRFAAAHKPPGKRLDRFIKKYGGLNGCGSEFAKQRRRSRHGG